MNTPLILNISAALLLSGVQSICPAKDAPRSEARTTKRQASSASIAARNNNGEGTVTYEGNEVWNGKVKKSLSAIAKDVEGEDYEYAAAWDGKKLVWENIKGAGDALKPALREFLKKQKALLK